MKKAIWIPIAFGGGTLVGLIYGFPESVGAGVFIGTVSIVLLLLSHGIEKRPALSIMILLIFGAGAGYGTGTFLGSMNQNPALAHLGILVGGLFAPGMGAALVILRRNRVRDMAGRIVLFGTCGFILGLIVLAPLGIWMGIMAELDRESFYPFLDGPEPGAPGDGIVPPKDPDEINEEI